jgi:hypothetical protein
MGCGIVVITLRPLVLSVSALSALLLLCSCFALLCSASALLCSFPDCSDSTSEEMECGIVVIKFKTVGA